MSAEPKKSKSAEAPPPPTVSPDVDETLHGLWMKYGEAAITFCAVVLLCYVVKVGWDYWRAQRELSLGREFASLSTPSQWKAFAEAHPKDRLAGLADIQVGDDAYLSGRMSTAEQAYEAAIPLLSGDPLQVRARIGAGVCLLQSGQTQEGETTLRAIFDDTTQLPVIRAEAGYELASAAASSGQAGEARAIAAKIVSLDPRSVWAQKALMLRPMSR